MAVKYITTTTPYVNSDPHIGFALEIIQADAWARAQTAAGHEVVFNTGTDEHGAKIYEKAQEEGMDTQAYVDKFAARFKSLKELLNLSFTNFIRTTDEYHKKAAQDFWKKCEENGDIYKKNYQIKYCVGCELAKTDSELDKNGRCPLHPNREVDLIDEENYFFKFSKYQKLLLELYDKQKDFVLPEHRLEEIRNFVAAGLEDFSISRIKEKMPWGVPVPGDDEHVMYVWFDALVNYISTIGWPTDMDSFNKSWPGVQVAGKDNLRQQSAMWQAMLMSAGEAPSKQIAIHGFISMNGEKISKSTGNIVDPIELVKLYGVDPVRYYLLREIPTLGDGDYSDTRMRQLYDSDLANELGNLLSRVTTLAAQDGIDMSKPTLTIEEVVLTEINNFRLNEALEMIWVHIKIINAQINEAAPWKLSKEERKDKLIEWLQRLHQIGLNLAPFMPETSEKIIKATTGKIQKISPLFPRL
ncbi:MAG: methionine--tRNA ligase [bacterium]|nr:methionine--tRNA ligase [bacterium]